MSVSIATNIALLVTVENSRRPDRRFSAVLRVPGKRSRNADPGQPAARRSIIEKQERPRRRVQRTSPTDRSRRGVRYLHGEHRHDDRHHGDLALLAESDFRRLRGGQSGHQEPGLHMGGKVGSGTQE